MEEKKFADVVAEKLAKHPRLKNLTSEALQPVIDYFETWSAIAAYGPEDLTRDFDLTAEDAAALVAVARAEAAKEAEAAKMTVQVHAEAEVAEEPEEEKPDKWAHLRDRISSLGLQRKDVMQVRVNPQILERLSKGAAAVVVFGAGLDKSVTEAITNAADIEDPTVTDRFYEYHRRVASGHWLPEEDLERLAEQMDALFGPKWQEVMSTVSRLAGIVNVHQLLAGGGVYQAGDEIVGKAGALQHLLPAVAEHMGRQFQTGFGVSIAQRAIEMHNSLLELLKDSDVQQACHISATDPDMGALKLLERYVNKHAQAVYRLAMVVEGLIYALGQCPAPHEMDRDYLTLVGSMALEYKTLFELAEAYTGKGGASTGEPFRPEPAVVEKTKAVRRFAISIDFGITIGSS